MASASFTKTSYKARAGESRAFFLARSKDMALYLPLARSTTVALSDFLARSWILVHSIQMARSLILALSDSLARS